MQKKGERNQTKTELHVSLVKAMRGRGVNRWIVRFFHAYGINYISILKAQLETLGYFQSKLGFAAPQRSAATNSV